MNTPKEREETLLHIRTEDLIQLAVFYDDMIQEMNAEYDRIMHEASEEARKVRNAKYKRKWLQRDVEKELKRRGVENPYREFHRLRKIE